MTEVDSRRLREVADQISAALPLERGGMVVETIQADENMLVLIGRGVLTDPDTPDASWTWQIINPPAAYQRDPLAAFVAEIDHMVVSR